MVIQIKCPTCSQPIRADQRFFGKKVKCPKCKTEFTVPDPRTKAGKQAEARPADPLVGKKIAHYQIESLLGQGGMGKVYRARNISLDKTCALKILPPEFAKQDSKLIERFIREARSAASIQHSNVLPVHFIGQEQGQYFIEMDYIEGGTLEDRLTAAPGSGMEPREAARIIRDVALALAAAQTKGIVHRDIKPSNVMLTKEGQVKVADFGLAKITGAATTSLTMSGMIVGTPLYMSPEQSEARETDHRSDIYSLGVMFYQLLTGSPPYTAGTPVAILLQHVREPIPDLRQAAPGVPPALAAIVTRMMAKKPEERYQSCAEVARDIDAFLTPRARVAASPKAARPKKKPRAGLYAAAAAVIVLITVASAFLVTRGGRTPRAPAEPRSVGLVPQKDTASKQAVPPSAGAKAATVTDKRRIPAPPLKKASPPPAPQQVGAPPAADRREISASPTKERKAETPLPPAAVPKAQSPKPEERLPMRYEREETYVVVAEMVA